MVSLKSNFARPSVLRLPCDQPLQCSRVGTCAELCVRVAPPTGCWLLLRSDPLRKHRPARFPPKNALERRSSADGFAVVATDCRPSQSWTPTDGSSLTPPTLSSGVYRCGKVRILFGLHQLETCRLIGSSLQDGMIRAFRNGAS